METNHLPQTALTPEAAQDSPYLGQRVLLIGPVWPEPRSSAAGKRSQDWIDFFRTRGAAEITFASIAKPDEHSARLESSGVVIWPVSPNDPAFDLGARSLKPDWIVLERFTIEEMFGWRLRENCPHAVQLLDTVDLHFLRRARAERLTDTQALQSVDALRELASLWRVDLGFVISRAECTLLLEAGLPAAQIGLYEFGYEPRALKPLPRADRPVDFSFIGNFRHDPNADAVRYLKRELWPEIRRRFEHLGIRPTLEIHGAYPSKEFMQMDRADQGFRVRGPAREAFEVLGRARVNLAPLRFGAGLKGKIADGWAVGTPCVATPVGAEGMGTPFGGIIAADSESFADACLQLHQNETLWNEAQKQGTRILHEQFSIRAQNDSLQSQLAPWNRAHPPLEFERELVHRLLRHHSVQSARHFSRWIELKNRPGPDQKNLATGIPNESPKLEDCAERSPEVRSPQLM